MMYVHIIFSVSGQLVVFALPSSIKFAHSLPFFFFIIIILYRHPKEDARPRPVVEPAVLVVDVREHQVDHQTYYNFIPMIVQDYKLVQ
jgi:hypothetical protein